MEIEETLSQRVARILYEEWDPIGLRRLGVKNQYARYAVGLVEACQLDANEERIVEYLVHVFIKIFGKEPDDLKSTTEVAQTLSMLLAENVTKSSIKSSENEDSDP